MDKVIISDDKKRKMEWAIMFLRKEDGIEHCLKIDKYLDETIEKYKSYMNDKTKLFIKKDYDLISDKDYKYNQELMFSISHLYQMKAQLKHKIIELFN